jgi:phenylacetate-coenzyme A ligase PaaK-like adenylate-forming protein
MIFTYLALRQTMGGVTTNRGYWDAEFECRAWDESQRWQAKMLPSLTARLRSESRLYAAKLRAVDPDSVASLDALSDLPMTTKDDLRRGQASTRPGLVLGEQQAVPADQIVQILSSSGTTGKPVYFGLTRADVTSWTNATAAMFFTAGLRPNSVTALSTGMPMVAGGLPYADGIRATGAALVWLGGQTTSRMVSSMVSLPVNSLIGTVSFQTFFAARVAEEIGRPASSLGVRTIIAGGEPGAAEPETRAAIQQSWGADRVSEVMGLCDVLPGIWGECQAGAGMHFTGGPDVLVELIDPDTTQPLAWTQGAEGELLYTTLTREATPVLRYRSRDNVRVVGMGCACGRNTPRIRCLGRTDDMLIYKAMNVFPAAIREIALTVGGGALDGMTRIRKERADQVRFDVPIPVEVQLREPLEDPARSNLCGRIEKAVQDTLRVRIAVECLRPGTFAAQSYKSALTYVG